MVKEKKRPPRKPGDRRFREELARQTEKQRARNNRRINELQLIIAVRAALEQHELIGRVLTMLQRLLLMMYGAPDQIELTQTLPPSPIIFGAQPERPALPWPLLGMAAAPQPQIILGAQPAVPPRPSPLLGIAAAPPPLISLDAQPLAQPESSLDMAAAPSPNYQHQPMEINGFESAEPAARREQEAPDHLWTFGSTDPSSGEEENIFTPGPIVINAAHANPSSTITDLQSTITSQEAIILQQDREARDRETEIVHLRREIARLNNENFRLRAEGSNRATEAGDGDRAAEIAHSSALADYRPPNSSRDRRLTSEDEGLASCSLESVEETLENNDTAH